MVERGVVCKFIKEEFINYKGFIYYILYYEVFKLDFKFIFVRIVFNSGVNYMGYVFNEYWVKGLDLFNSLFGIFV